MTVDVIGNDKITTSHFLLKAIARVVNETFRSETETRPRHLCFSPRRDRDQDLPTFLRDRDETETFEFQPETRPRRDSDRPRPRHFSRRFSFFSTCQSHERNYKITIWLFQNSIIIDWNLSLKVNFWIVTVEFPSFSMLVTHSRRLAQRHKA